MESRTTVLAVAVVLVSASLAVAVAPAAAGAPADGQQGRSDDVVHQCAADPPADFEDPDRRTDEVVGWVEGYWYSEPLNLSAENGLTEGELDRLSARTAARFEALRCLTVQDGLPPVDIVPREEFAEDPEPAVVGETQRLLDNAKFETTLTIDSQTDSIEIRQTDSAERVGGFYDFISEEIVIVTDDPSALRIDESTLAEELGHAIQDQHFDISQYERPTVDRDKGILGLLEGDVGLVVDEYLRACEAGEWSEPCLTEGGETGGSGPEIANWGLYFEEIHPYSDGLSFVQQTRATGGWEAVNALYEKPPTSALHVTYPDTLGAVEPIDLTVPDRSTDAWSRVVLENVPASDGPLTHDTLGISTITGMFGAPAYEENTTSVVLTQRQLVNIDDSGSVDQFDPHEFAHPETEGWRGDSFYTYRNGSNETATLWELAWASAEDAEPFVEGYEQLVDIRGGERVDGYAHTYTFDNWTGYDIALTLVPDGDRVTVVTAPTVEALTDVDQQLELLPAGSDEDDTDDPDGSGEEGGGEGSSDGSGGEGSGDEGAGEDGSDGGGGEGSGDEGTGEGGSDGGGGEGSGDEGAGEDGSDGGGGGSDGDSSDGPDSVTSNGTGDSEDGSNGSSDAELGIIVLPAVGTSFLILLALLSTGRQRGS